MYALAIDGEEVGKAKGNIGFVRRAVTNAEAIRFLLEEHSLDVLVCFSEKYAWVAMTITEGTLQTRSRGKKPKLLSRQILGLS